MAHAQVLRRTFTAAMLMGTNNGTEIAAETGRGLMRQVQSDFCLSFVWG